MSDRQEATSRRMFVFFETVPKSSSVVHDFCVVVFFVCFFFFLFIIDVLKGENLSYS